MTIIIGLTGSIATGKSFVAKCFARLGASVFDADKAVHSLLESGGDAVRLVREEFPDCYIQGEIDRKILGEIVFNDEKKRKRLESIIHPLVSDLREEFLLKAKNDKVKIAVLEIPLLFESGLQKKCNYVVTTTVREDLQKQRAMQRPGMTEDKFESINELQMDSEEKVQKSDFEIDTSVSEFSVFKRVKEIIEKVS